MNASELKENIDLLFPCKWLDDFADNLNDLFSRFIKIVKISGSLNQESLSFIEELCYTIIEIIQYYYEGRRWLAFEKFSIIMNGKGESVGLFDRLGKRTIGTPNVRINTKEQYENSIFAFIEKDLHKSEFEELEHLYIPEGVIYLDYLGTPVDVPIYASYNCQYKIVNEN